ncbi:hypothetical protein DM867_09115 [Halosegnis rubeus]|jgi:nicotinamidase-related amidase|uniref:Uncharacterized protein n=1 Tax=Halosegnis rubeus TaxID=2212850 RepID=A0A5N5U935_9EURY|nr:hypothetical protein [Halosegnis rubeus]KAB7513940.1 hypothetical protein DM867_09115 [Halosegnis rubeus]KAB7514341.1 hypothetical protein DMP03_10765 [Halosegnis rubeus]KAB7518747.1 hypothetical protein DP108_06150 [Halosegnis rubeus]
MPSVEITDDQQERFAAIRDQLTAAHAGEYTSVQPADVMAYLLDVAEAAGEPATATEDAPRTGADTTASDDDSPDEDEPSDGGSGTDGNPGSGESGGGIGAGPGMLNLLEDHEEKWREADGDARYEVDLPDGSTETARTRDDVKAILFKHHR